MKKTVTMFMDRPCCELPAERIYREFREAAWWMGVDMSEMFYPAEKHNTDKENTLAEGVSWAWIDKVLARQERIKKVRRHKKFLPRHRSNCSA